MFALTRNLAKKCDVSEIVVPLAHVQRHMLGPLAARFGAAHHRDDVVRAAVFWARIGRDLPPVIERMVAAGVAVAPIKGVAYAAGVYDAPADRPMTDIDLLVPPASEPRAGRILADAGFTRFADTAMHHASTWVRGDLVIDLHRGIVGAGRSSIDLAALWARTRPGWPDGAMRLDPTDEFLFHLIHMARNRLCGPLIHIVDAVRLRDRVASLDEAFERSRAWGTHVATGVAWKFVASIVDDRPALPRWLAPEVDDVIELRSPSVPRKLVFDVATAGGPRQLAARLLAYGAARLSRQ